MPQPAKVVARSNLRWLSVLKSCLIVFAVISLSACTLTSSSSSTASLISKGSAPPAARAKTAPKPEAASQIASAQTDENQFIDDPLNLAEAVVAEDATAVGAVPNEAAAPVAEASAPETVSIQGAEAETVSAEVMESALATIQKAESQLGLIDKNLCTNGLNGNLITGQAGQGLLRDNGIKSAYNLTGEIMPPPPSFELAAAEFSAPDPAPSAGTSETTSITSLNIAKNSTSSSKTASKSAITESLLMTAYEQTGRHYKSGGQSPDTGFDAPGFTRWVYAQRGLSLPKDAAKQANGGRQVTKDELRPGDLLVYRDGEGGGYHVGIYTGQGNFLHCASKTGVVTETAAFGPQYSPYFVGGRRYYDDPQAGPLSDVQKMSATSSAVKLALSELGPDDTLKRPGAKKKPVKTAAAKTSSKKKKK